MTALTATSQTVTAKDEEDSALHSRVQQARRRRRALVWFGRIVAPVVFLGGWQLLASNHVIDPFLYGKPSLIWKSLVDLFTKGTAFGSIWLNLWTTIKEAILGFLLGTAVGIVVGVLLGQVRYLSEVFGPYIKVANAVPRIVLGSIFIIAFGLGIFPKVLIAAVLVFFVVFFNAFQGVREVDQNLVSNVKVLGASPLEVIRHVTIPSALTWIIASLHTAFGFAIIGALVAEVLGAQHGIGLIISQAQGTFDPNTVFACMAIMAVVTLLAEYVITFVEKRLQSWRPPNRLEVEASAF